MKNIFFFLCAFSFSSALFAQVELVQIGDSTYVANYIPINKAIEGTKKGIAACDNKLKSLNDQLDKILIQIKDIQAKKVGLETALHLLENPAPTKTTAPPASAPANEKQPKKTKKVKN